MYVGKNHGYSRAYAEGYERIFGASKPPLRHTEGKTPSSNDDIDVAWRFATITFPEGPLGLEVTWSSPPVVTAAFPEGAAASAGICVGDIIVEANGVQVNSQLRGVLLATSSLDPLFINCTKYQLILASSRISMNRLFNMNRKDVK